MDEGLEPGVSERLTDGVYLTVLFPVFMDLHAEAHSPGGVPGCGGLPHQPGHIGRGIVPLRSRTTLEAKEDAGFDTAIDDALEHLAEALPAFAVLQEIEHRATLEDRLHEQPGVSPCL